MNNKSLIAGIAIVGIAVIGFLFYRQNGLENQLIRQQQQAQAQQQVVDEIKARDRARADLQNEPSKFIKAGPDWDVVRRGTFSTYSRATAIELINSSKFDVADVSGKLTYLNAAGAEIATVPFAADGDV